MAQLPISPDRRTAEKAFAEMTQASRFAMPSQREPEDEDIPDGPPSKCTGACSGKRNAEIWDDRGFCRFCGEDGNA